MKKEEALTKLMNREITPSECMIAVNITTNKELETLVNSSGVNKTKRKKLTIENIDYMNYLEVREYCNEKLQKGINLKDLGIELDLKWENGTISGFDYRYFKESVDLKITKEFISRAKSIGRYGK